MDKGWEAEGNGGAEAWGARPGVRALFRGGPNGMKAKVIRGLDPNSVWPHTLC